MASGSAGPDIGVLTNKLRQDIDGCSSEEDLRVSVELILRNTLSDLPTPKYEQAIRCSTFNGRADAVHQGLVIEYEKPRSMRGQARREEAVQQVCEYLT